MWDLLAADGALPDISIWFSASFSLLISFFPATWLCFVRFANDEEWAERWMRGNVSKKKKKVGRFRAMDAFCLRGPANVWIFPLSQFNIQISAELLKNPHIFALETMLLFCLCTFFYMHYMFAVSEIPSSLKLQLCRSVINHRQECGKQRGRAALASMYTGQRCICGAPGEMNACEVSAGKHHHSLATLAKWWKQMQGEQREAPWLPLPLSCSSAGRWMHRRRFPCTQTRSFSTLWVDRWCPHGQKKMQKCISWQRSGWKCERGAKQCAFPVFKTYLYFLLYNWTDPSC